MKTHSTAVALFALPLMLSPPGAGRAEQVHRIGYLSHGPSPALDALRGRLRTLGWIEGRNLQVEYRLTDGRDERIPGLAADLVRIGVDLIVAAGSNYADAALHATRTIPIVFCAHGDPVGAGHVASLSHPGGNVTGVSNQLTELSGKQLELLDAAVPGRGPVAVLWNPASPPHDAALPAVKAAAQDLGIEIRLVPARTAAEFDAAFRTMSAEQVRAALALVSPSYYVHHARLAELASEYRLPAMLGWSEFAKAGGLMSYGPNLNEMFGRCAGLVDKLLKGGRPADIPVEQASTYQLVVNLRAARRLNLTIPASILAVADEVTE